MDAAARDRRQRRLLVGIALIFFAPLGFSFYLYYGHHDWHPRGHTNAGELIQPARPLPEAALPLVGSGATRADFLRGKWTFLYFQHDVCADACRMRLYDTRQVRIALDRDMNRVQRVLIADAGCCDFAALHEAHPDLIIALTAPADAALRAQLPEDAGSDAHRVYVVDPLGNLMMFYGPDAKAKGMLEDTKRLLRLSSIG